MRIEEVEVEALEETVSCMTLMISYHTLPYLTLQGR